MKLRFARHPDPPEWLDYVRGRLAEPLRARMKLHLRAGCEACARLVHSLQAIVRDAAAESGPPDHSVRGAIALFSVARGRDTGRFRRLPVEISYDSRLQPAMTGVRNVGYVDRRLVLNAGRFTVDTRLDQAESRDELSVVGQLMSRGGFPVPDVPAFLASGGEIISTDSTSALGEFHMTCRPRRRLRLCLSVGGTDLIELSFSLESPPGEETQVAE